MDKNILEAFRKKIRIALLGEPSLISQHKVITLCEEFFKDGIEYGKNSSNNGS